jgi:hypothetical protein
MTSKFSRRSTYFILGSVEYTSLIDRSVIFGSRHFHSLLVYKTHSKIVYCVQTENDVWATKSIVSSSSVFSQFRHVVDKLQVVTDYKSAKALTGSSQPAVAGHRSGAAQHNSPSASKNFHRGIMLKCHKTHDD